MDLSQYSTEQLKQMAGLSQPKNDLSSYSTEDLLKMAGIEKKRNPLTQEELADVDKKAAELRGRLGIDTSSSLGDVVNNKYVRGTVSGMQKMLDSSYNPVGIMAKGLNYSFGNGEWKLPKSLKPDIVPQNATERAISNTLDYGQDALTFLTGAQALKGAGLLGKGTSTASKLARGLASGTTGEALASAGGAGTLTGIVDPDTWYGNLATDVAGGMLGGGLLSGVKSAKNAFDIRRGGKELQKQLSSGKEFSDIKYGKISNKKLDDINKIRLENGLEPITKADVSIPADRVGHLYEERVLGNNYTPKEVDDVIKGTVHNDQSVVGKGNTKQYQVMDANGTSGGKRSVVGSHRDTNQVFVKTAYKTDAKGIKKGEVKTSPKLVGENESLLHHSLTNNNITQNASNVKENNFINALSDTNKVKRLKNAVQSGENGIQEQADDLLNRMIARQNGNYDEALEQAIKTPKMEQADLKYDRFMAKNGGERLSKKAVDEFYRENPIANGLIKEARVVDPQSFQGVSRGSLKEFDMLKRMLRKMKGNQSEKTVSQTAAENAEKAVKKLMDDSFNGFREVNKEYAAASLAQDLFEKKIFNNVKNLSKTQTSPFWSGITSPLTSAGAVGGFFHPAVWGASVGGLAGKQVMRALRRQAGRAIMNGKTPISDATILGVMKGLNNVGKSAIKYGKYPAISEILNKKGE